MKKTVLFAASSAAMMLAGPVAAETTGQETTAGAGSASTCLDELERMQTEAGDGQISDAARRDIRQLKDAARVLAERGRNDDCNAMVQSVNEIREKERSKLQKEQDMQALRSARPITEHQQVVKASAINGSTVRNTEDQELGTIEETVIDPKTGKVSYVVLSHGGFVGVGEKLIAVPWDQLRVVEGDNEEETFYVLSASDAYLTQREGLGEQDWPAEIAQEWNPDEESQ